VFRIPLAVPGRAAAEFRGGFERAEPVPGAGRGGVLRTLLGGRTSWASCWISAERLRVALNEVGSLSGPGRELKTGDSFALVCLSGLPFTPPPGPGRLVHLARGAASLCGKALEGLAEGT